MENLKTKTEEELRNTKVESPKNIEELIEIINQLTERQHDYGTCVYAMSIGAVATFMYIASRLNVTGFQVSCADFDFIKRTRGMEEGVSIINYNNLLYPPAQKLLEKNKEVKK